MGNLGQEGAPTRQSQVGEERAKIGEIMTQLSEAIGILEQRLQVCLRQDLKPCDESKKSEKVISEKVELANWLSIHAEDLQKQVYRIREIFERCEL